MWRPVHGRCCYAVFIKPSRIVLPTGLDKICYYSRHLKTFFLTLFPFGDCLPLLHDGVCGAGADSAQGWVCDHALPISIVLRTHDHCSYFMSQHVTQAGQSESIQRLLPDLSKNGFLRLKVVTWSCVRPHCYHIGSSYLRIKPSKNKTCRENVTQNTIDFWAWIILHCRGGVLCNVGCLAFLSLPTRC